MANAVDYSIGFTTAQVEDILAVQKAELKKTLAAYANDGSTATKRRSDVPRSVATTRPGRASGTGPIHAIIGACQRALQKLDPQRYPPPVRVGVSSVDRPLGL